MRIRAIIMIVFLFIVVALRGPASLVVITRFRRRFIDLFAGRRSRLKNMVHPFRQFLTMLFALIMITTTVALGPVRTPLSPSAPVERASPQAKRVLSVAGTASSYVEVPHDPALNPTDSFTLEAWVKRDNGDRCESIIRQGVNYWLGFCNTRIRFYAAGSANGEDGNAIVPADVWTHIAAVYQASGRRYYINGELDYAGGPEPSPTTSTHPVYIGGDPTTGGDNSFDGHISNVRFWNRARTQDEIRRTMHVALTEPLPGLVANWRFSEGYEDNIGGFDGLGNGTFLTDSETPPAQPVYADVVDTNYETLSLPSYSAATAYIPALDRILLIGGQSDPATVVDRIDAIDAGTGRQIALGSLPEALTRSGAVYAPNTDTVYLFGGSSSSSATMASAQNSIYEIDPGDGAINAAGTILPAPTTAMAAAYHPLHKKVYLFGGLTPGGAVNTISIFDPIHETLTDASGLSLPEPLYDLAATYSAATDKIYLFGGYDGFDPRNTIYEVTLDPEGLNSSVDLLTVQLPRDNQGPPRAFADPFTHLIYLVGGSSQEWLWAFDPVTKELWSTFIPQPNPTYTPSVAYSARNRQVLIIGGDGDAGWENIWRIPLGDGPAVPLGHWDFPAPLNSAVTALDGDERSLLVGTASDGAWRYDSDGSRYHYTPGSLGSASGHVTDVRYDAANDESWLATVDAGARQYNGSTLIQLYGAASIGTDNVQAVDIPGVFGTWDRGQVELGQIGSPPINYWRHLLDGERVNAITHRAPDDRWIISNGDLVHIEYDPIASTVTDYSASQCGLTQPADLAFGPNGDWWIVSPENFDIYQAGICRIPAADTPGTGNSLIAPHPDIGPFANSVDRDADGRMWVSLGQNIDESGGLSVFEVTGASNNEIRTEDYNWLSGPVGDNEPIDPGGTRFMWDSSFSAVGAADERVWTGKEDGRLITLAKRWQQLAESNSLGDEVINGIWTVRGRAFMATDDSLHVLLPDGKTWDNHVGIEVRAVLGDSRGRTWVGTGTGIRLYTPNDADGDGWDFLAGPEGVRPDYPIDALAEDRSGRIWLGGLNGLTLFDRNRFVATFNSANSGLPADSVHTLLVDRDNRLWAGTDAGLAVLERETWTAFTTADGLPHNQIHDLAQLGSGEIAISTADGLSLYHDGSFSAETPPIPAVNLPLAVDELGRLWAGSAVRRASGAADTTWQAYYWTNSGLSSSQVSDNATDGADRIWFSHAPDTGVSVRGTYLPPLADVVPNITAVTNEDGSTPARGSSGDVIIITGSGFGSNRRDVVVTVGGAPAQIISVSGTEIRVRLTDNSTSGDVSVTVGRRRDIEADAFCAVPVITNFDPTGGNDGVRVTIDGTNFDYGAEVSLGGPLRDAAYVSPTELWLHISSDDSTGPVQVVNSCADAVATSSAEFRRFAVSLDAVFLEQGISSTGLVAGRETMIRHYLSYTETLRPGDSIDVDTVELNFIEDSTVLTPTIRIPYSQTVPIFPSQTGFPTETLRSDIVNSLNVVTRARVEGNIIPGKFQGVQTVLKKEGRVVAQGIWTAVFRPNHTIHVLLVPIMRNNHNPAELLMVRNTVNPQLDDLQRRLMPTGDVVLHWSPLVFEVQDVLITDPAAIDLGEATALYDASHELDYARQRWNETRDPDVMIALGVVQDAAVNLSSNSGQAWWPDVTELINDLGLNVLDAFCDIGDEFLGLFGLGGDGCDLQIPLYVGWACHNCFGSSLVGSSGAVFGHEIGHILGLVRAPWANYDGGNLAHSRTDELASGTCGGGVYTSTLTLYAAANVTEPVINVLTGRQFRPQLTVNSLGLPAGPSTNRGKAIMSYACQFNNDNVFFEPSDVDAIFSDFSAISGANFFSLPVVGPAKTAANEAHEAPSVVAPRSSSASGSKLVPGQRLYVSGLINRADETGELRQVEVLAEDASLTGSTITGYWLVQLDDQGQELSRTGLFPIFSTSESADNDLGFFATTVLRDDNVAALELRHDETVLDSYNAGPAPPTISISSPDGGHFDTGSVPVTWTASDPDGDDVSITILYSPDDGVPWTPYKLSSGNGSIDLPVEQLPGGNAARVQVIASDGLNQSSATSNVFSVADQPPLAFIGHPISTTTILEGELINLSGGADDNQDGAIAGANLHWRSDRDGELGTGAPLGVFLSVGQHLLTLEALNSAGLTATTSVSVTVIGDYDYDGLSDEEELSDGLNLLAGYDAYSDDDGDGLPLIMERKRNLDPNNADTDGDGRSDAEEIAAGNDPNAADSPLPSDALNVTPTRLAFEADLARDVPLPQEPLDVFSRRAMSWTLSSDVDWLAASMVSGQTPAGTTIMVEAFKLSDGFHTATMTFTNDTGDSIVTVPLSVTVTNSAAFFDQDGNGLNVGDVQTVANHNPSDNDQDDFNYRRDVDRDGDVDDNDVQRIAQRWISQRSCCGSGHPTAPSTIQVSAPPTTTVGGLFSVDFLLSDAQSVAGFELDLSFDPARLAVQSVSTGDFLGSTGRSVTLLGPVVDNGIGLVSLGGFTEGDTAEASGSGLLARITFRALHAGDSALTIQKHLLTDAEGALSVGTTQDGAVTVVEGGLYDIYLPLILR